MTLDQRIAAVIVTCNSERFLEPTLASIDAQEMQPNVRIAVDDFSTDDTRELLVMHGFAIHDSTTTALDRSTRIAQNFHQGVRTAQATGADIVILGDHDDLWHVDRIRHQVDRLREDPHIAMLASDGFLIDEHGTAVPGTIRGTFPVPVDFDSMPLRRRLSYAARHSIATGGASAVRPAALADWSVPTGWLHDRWWSLATLRAGRFRSDCAAVIDYRLSDDQQVGLDSRDQESPVRWLRGRARHLGTTVRRVRDASGLARDKASRPTSGG